MTLPWPRCSRMHVESKTAAHGTHRKERFVPGEAPQDLPDRRTARNDREHGRAAPGQVRLPQTRCPQPCAQRLQIAPTAPQNCFETIATTHERQRFNSLPPNGPRKSEVVLPRCQAISDSLVTEERQAGGNAPIGDRDHGAERRSKSQRPQKLTATHPERRSALKRERDIRSKFQRAGRTVFTRHPFAMERQQRSDRRGGIGAAAAHP